MTDSGVQFAVLDEVTQERGRFDVRGRGGHVFGVRGWICEDLDHLEKEGGLCEAVLCSRRAWIKGERKEWTASSGGELLELTRRLWLLR